MVRGARDEGVFAGTQSAVLWFPVDAAQGRRQKRCYCARCTLSKAPALGIAPETGETARALFGVLGNRIEKTINRPSMFGRPLTWGNSLFRLQR